MTRNASDGGPAFPRPVSEDRTSGDQLDGNTTVSEQDGMTLRDYMAAHALAGLLARAQGGIALWKFEGTELRADKVAEVAYQFADAMLEARKLPELDTPIPFTKTPTPTDTPDLSHGG